MNTKNAIHLPSGKIVLDVVEKAYQERVPVLIDNPLMSEIKAAEKRRTPNNRSEIACVKVSVQ
jgi:hypothetical protein